VSYDGTAFAGSQRQANGRTVQEELERAAQALFGEPVRVAMAGRTDAGVHAIGQVAAFSVDSALEPPTVGRALNAHLPDDVAVRDVRQVPADFNPRYWARRRWYRYTILDSETRMPLIRAVAWQVRASLDLGAMGRAAEALVGQQDFRACSAPLEPGRSPVRTVFEAGWQRDGCQLTFDIQADAFLPQMVRRLTGALVQVGRGSLHTDDFVRTLRQATPATLGPTAPARGLCLQRVWYDEGYRT
jgi:tRNA pseudouridine38-40 synthase